MIELGGYAMILKVDWMGQYSPMVFDFARATLKFNYEDMEVALNGVQRGDI